MQDIVAGYWTERSREESLNYESIHARVSENDWIDSVSLSSNQTDQDWRVAVTLKKNFSLVKRIEFTQHLPQTKSSYKEKEEGECSIPLHYKNGSNSESFEFFPEKKLVNGKGEMILEETKLKILLENYKIFLCMTFGEKSFFEFRMPGLEIGGFIPELKEN